MIYEYACSHCETSWDVVKPAKEMQTEELCVQCRQIAKRRFLPTRVWFNGTKVEHAEYNPGLGCIVRNKSHRQELCKIKGVEEIGNEKPETLHKHFDHAREEKREKAWEEATQGWIGSEG